MLPSRILIQGQFAC